MSIQGDFARSHATEGAPRSSPRSRARTPASACSSTSTVRPTARSAIPSSTPRAKGHVEDLIWTEQSEVRGDLFVDVCAPPPRLVIFGAVEFAVHLSAYAKIADWRAYVVDPRARFATQRALPRRDRRRRRLARRRLREARRDRSRDLPHRPDARSQARRCRPADGAEVRRSLHRRDGLQARAEGTPRAPDGPRHHRRGDRAHQRAGRPRPRCHGRPARPRCRSWPSASPCATGATAGGCARRAQTASASTPRPSSGPEAHVERPAARRACSGDPEQADLRPSYLKTLSRTPELSSMDCPWASSA